MSKTIADINKKIENRTVQVFRADEMTRMVREIGAEKAAETVDVVTTGTFGAMCSSGVFLNFGHFQPPIRMERIRLNDVDAYGGLAAVDTYLGAAQPSRHRGIDYGGGHVIEDLLKGNKVRLKAYSSGTDCYPRKKLLTEISLDDLNQAVLCNPRNAYQRYNAATNSTPETLFTYMGKLLPRFGNITFSGAGELSPLMNDPEFKTIGVGTRIFLGGGQGYVMGNGTQHDPDNGFSTLMVKGDLKNMSPDFVRAATFAGYGCTLYVGIGIPIPILNGDLVRSTSVSDREIHTSVLDYGHSETGKKVLGTVSYAELKSGRVNLDGREVRCSSLSSTHGAIEIAGRLKDWIHRGMFFLTQPVEPIANHGPLEVASRIYLKNTRDPYPVADHDGSRRVVRFWEKNRCIHCGLCLSFCPRDVFKAKKGGKISADETLCNHCDRCSDICPVGAIHHDYQSKQ